MVIFRICSTHFLEHYVCAAHYMSLASWNTDMQIATRMWANAQRDGRPAEHRWRPLFNAAKFG